MSFGRFLTSSIVRIFNCFQRDNEGFKSLASVCVIKHHVIVSNESRKGLRVNFWVNNYAVVI